MHKVYLLRAWTFLSLWNHFFVYIFFVLWKNNLDCGWSREWRWKSTDIKYQTCEASLVWVDLNALFSHRLIGTASSEAVKPQSWLVTLWTQVPRHLTRVKIFWSGILWSAPRVIKIMSFYLSKRRCFDCCTQNELRITHARDNKNLSGSTNDTYIHGEKIKIQ